MSTSKTYQQSLADAGSKTRPPMLERGSYIPWASRFRRYINRKRENQKWLNKALDEGPYQFQMFVPTGSTLPTLQTQKEILQGDEILHYDAEIELMNLILLSIPNEIYNSVDACTTAKEMWKRVERLMRGTIQNQVDRETRFTNEFDQFVAEPGEALVSVYNRFAQLMNDLERNKMIFPSVKVNTKFLNSLQSEWLKYVTQVRLAKRLTVDSFDDLFDYLQQFEKLVNALRAKKLEKSHDPLVLVSHTDSSSRNTSSYCVTHPTFVVDYDDEYQTRVNSNQFYEDPTSHYNVEIIRLFNATTIMEKDIMLGIFQSQEFVIQNTSWNKCCYKQYEARVIFTDEQKSFSLCVCLQGMEEIENLLQTYSKMAQDPTCHKTLMLGQAMILHLLVSTIGDDQIDSNIIFNEPNRNVNSGSVEKDTHVKRHDDEESIHEDASDTGATPKQKQQVIPQTTTAISNIKLPILKKEEYDIWAMEMEHY
ncbi:hypothetical protein Tco_1156664 [Tanacetum coccineum]